MLGIAVVVNNTGDPAQPIIGPTSFIEAWLVQLFPEILIEKAAGMVSIQPVIISCATKNTV